MLHRKHITIQEYKTSTEKKQRYVYIKKVGEFKGENITDENGGIIEYGNDFTNCKFIHDGDST